MRYYENRFLRFMTIFLLILALFCTVLSPALEKNLTIDSSQTAMKKKVALHSMVWAKMSISAKKLLPVPNLQVLFVIFPLLLMLRIIRFFDATSPCDLSSIKKTVFTSDQIYLHFCGQLV